MIREVDGKQFDKSSQCCSNTLKHQKQMHGSVEVRHGMPLKAGGVTNKHLVSTVYHH